MFKFYIKTSWHVFSYFFVTSKRLTIKSQALKRKKFEKFSKNISKKGHSKADTRQVP